jgi:hypothetical protein
VELTSEVLLNCKKEKILTILLNPFNSFKDIIINKIGNFIILNFKGLESNFMFFIDADKNLINYILEGEKSRFDIKFELEPLISEGVKVRIILKYEGKGSLLNRGRIKEILDYIKNKISECK